MADFVQDTFTEAADTALTSHTGEIGATWVKNNFSTTSNDATVSAATGTLVQTTTNYEYYYASGTPPTADYSVSADFVIQSTDNFRQAAVNGRMSQTTGDMYQLELDPNDNALYLRSIVGGTTTDIGSVPSFGVTVATYNVQLQMSGTTITAYVGGVLKITATNADHTAAGNAGLMIRQVTTTAGPKLDNFVAAPLASGTSVTSTTGSVTLASPKASVNAVKAITGMTAAVTVAPQAATVTVSSTTAVTSSTAAATLSAPAARVNAVKSIVSSTAAISVTPNAATVTTGNVTAVAASTAAIAVSPNVARVNAIKAITATTGAVSVNGQTARVNAVKAITATKAAVSVSPNAATVSRLYAVLATTAPITFSAKQASVTAITPISITATTASIALSTTAATITLSGWQSTTPASTTWTPTTPTSTTWV